MTGTFILYRLLGVAPQICYGVVAYGKLRVQWDGRNPIDEYEIDQLMRSFLLYMFGCTIFADTISYVDLCLLLLLHDVDNVRGWDWAPLP